MIHIEPFEPFHIPLVKKFTDVAIGKGYYSLEELAENQKKSICKNKQISSFVLINAHKEVKGLRLAYPPGNWDHGKGSKLRPDLWPHPLNETGYFQSLFISKDLQGQSWGPRLSQKSIEILKNNHAAGIATHSWKESPNNSSVRYLEKIGFKKIIEHPLYWNEVDYTCTLDGKPCKCTAIEMYLDLKTKSPDI